MKPRNHITLAMLKAPKRGSLVHKGKAGNHRKDLNMETEQDWCMEDVPTYKVTVEVIVSGWDSDRASDHIERALMAMRQEDECDIFDWDFTDAELT
jgi:hypothetical protein